MVTGLILIAVGAILYVIGLRAGEPARGVLQVVGLILLAFGVVLILVGVVDDADAWSGPALLTVGAVGGAGAGAVRGVNEQDLPVGGGTLTDRQPVVVAFIIGAVPLILAAVTGLADVWAGIPDWIVPVLTTIGTLTTGLAALWARLRVTPTLMPETDDGEPLVPATEAGWEMVQGEPGVAIRDAHGQPLPPTDSGVWGG